MKNTPSIIYLVAFNLFITSLSGCGGDTAVQQQSSSIVSSNNAQSSSVTVSSSSASISSGSSISSLDSNHLVFAINSGSNNAATMNGIKYNADRFASGGTTNSTSDSIAGTDDDELFQSERYGNFSYEIPVTNNTYTVVVHAVELYHTAAGARSFNVVVEEDSLAAGLDVFAEAGHDTAYTLTSDPVVVSDGYLTLDLETVVDNATISGLAIYSNDGGEFIEPPDLTYVAQPLDALYFDVACAAGTSTPLATGATCVHPTNTQRITKTITIGGDASTTYVVTLRVRGIWEPTSITGGTLPVNGAPFTVGGAVTGGVGSSSDSVNYQQYYIEVSAPAQTYWLNNYQRTGHEIYKEDYQAQIIALGGSEITVIMNDGNERQIANFTGDLFSDLPPYDVNPSLGQTLRLDVISVQEQN